MSNLKATNNINYEGFVNFKIYQKKKLRKNFTIHNSGKPALFSFLATCLSGKLQQRLRPKLLSFSWGGTSTSPVQTNQVIVEDGSATYTWVVPVTVFSDKTLNGTTSINVRLCNSAEGAEASYVCAQAILSSSAAQDYVKQGFQVLCDIIQSQSTNYVLVISWQLNISDITVNTEQEGEQ